MQVIGPHRGRETNDGAPRVGEKNEVYKARRVCPMSEKDSVKAHQGGWEEANVCVNGVAENSARSPRQYHGDVWALRSGSSGCTCVCVQQYVYAYYVVYN